MRLFLILGAALWCAPTLMAGDDVATKRTIAFVQGLQTETGGFITNKPKPGAKPNEARLLPNLRATSAAVRALHYLGGSVPNKETTMKFVELCWDETAGGFAELGGPARGDPDVFTTAVGLMAVAELKMPTEKYGAAAVKYLSENARSFEDIRIAVAGLERLNLKSPRAMDWLVEVRKLQNDDGSFGKGPGQARATGGSVVTLLRLGGDVSNRDAVIKILKNGQRMNGGYGKDDDEIASDLETTYRVMRCFVMLKARPDNVEGVRSFVAKCRNEDGGYGIAPGQPSTVNATYFAAIIRYWLDKKQ